MRPAYGLAHFMGIGQFAHRKLRLVAGRRNDDLAHTEDAIEETLIDLHRADMPKRDGQPLFLKMPCS